MNVRGKKKFLFFIFFIYIKIMLKKNHFYLSRFRVYLLIVLIFTRFKEQQDIKIRFNEFLLHAAKRRQYRKFIASALIYSFYPTMLIYNLSTLNCFLNKN
jgi:hypothetical protein